MSVALLAGRVQSLGTVLLQKKATYDYINRSLTAVKAEIEKKKQLLDVLDKTSALLQRFASAKRQEMQERISGVISYGLSMVYDKPLKFIIEDKVGRNDLQFEFRIEAPMKGERVVLDDNLEDSEGGGLINIVSFLLRIMVILLHPDKPRRIIIGDEPLSMLDEVGGRTERMAELIKELAEKLDFQIVITTHQQSLKAAADKVYYVSNNDGITTCKSEK